MEPMEIDFPDLSVPEPMVAKNVIFFNNRQEVVHALTSRSNLLSVLLKNHDACPLILSKNPKIRFIKRLGEGVQGAVFEVAIEGIPKNYVVKKAVFDEANTKECDFKGVNVNNFQYVCTSSELIEYIISILLSPRYTRFANFSDVFSLYLCTDPNSMNMADADTYMFTEFLHGVTLWDVRDPLSFDSCVLQVLAAVMYYQQPHLMIQHNDLHTRNVMCVNKETVVDPRGNSIPQDIKYFGYWSRSRGKYYYFPAGQYVAKIIDFGLACKYSYPRVLNKKIAEFPEHVLNYWAPWYDPLFFVYAAKDVFTTKVILSAVSTGLGVSKNSALKSLDAEFNDKLRPVKSVAGRPDVRVRRFADTFTADNIFYSIAIQSDEHPKNTVLLGELP